MYPIRPSIDPLAQRAAIDALQAQRSAYRRYAQMVEAQRGALGDGDGDRAAATGDVVAAASDALGGGARQLQPVVARARAAATEADHAVLDGHMDDMMSEARVAESAIQTLTTQLEAWRDAYSRQLDEVGRVAGQQTQGYGSAKPAYGASPSSRHVLDRRA